jgi:hypothetical protein
MEVLDVARGQSENGVHEEVVLDLSAFQRNFPSYIQTLIRRSSYLESQCESLLHPYFLGAHKPTTGS